MKKIVIKDCNIPKIDRNIACIGYFDGVHRGHQKLIKETLVLAKKNNLKSMVICFEPDPEDVISKSKNKHILSFEDRLTSFESLGIDIVCVIKFDEILMKLKANAFIHKYLKKMNINTLICGYDFSFGYKGEGKPELLSKSINVIVIDEVSYYSKKISSTRIKQAINEGNFKLVNKLLGYEYSIMVKAINVSKKGSKWLIEANSVDNNLVMPRDGTYNGFDIKNNRFILTSKDKIDINDNLLLVFKNE